MVKLFILKIFFDIFDWIFRQPNQNCYHCFNSEASHLWAECFDFIASLYIFPYKEQRASLFRCYIFHLGTFTSPPWAYLDIVGCLLKENVHNCVLFGWSFYFYSHKNCSSITIYTLREMLSCSSGRVRTLGWNTSIFTMCGYKVPHKNWGKKIILHQAVNKRPTEESCVNFHYSW